MPRYYSYIDSTIGLGSTTYNNMVEEGSEYGVVPSIDIVARNITATGAFIGTLGNSNNLFENITVTGIATVGIVTGSGAIYYGDGSNLTGVAKSTSDLTNDSGFITNSVTGDFSVSGNVSAGSINSVTVGTGPGNYVTNLAVGSNALNANTTGQYNAAVGQFALYSNKTGDRNSAVGRSALVSNVSGDFNTAIGEGAGSQLTGSSNTIVGAFPCTGEASLSNTIIFAAGATERIRCNSSGNWLIGGTSAAPNIELRNDGRIKTVTEVIAGSNPASGNAVGSRLTNTLGAQSCGNVASSYTYQGFLKGTSTPTFEVFANGNVATDGSVTAVGRIESTAAAGPFKAETTLSAGAAMFTMREGAAGASGKSFLYGVADGTQTFNVSTSGVITAAGDVKIGGTSSAPNIELDASFGEVTAVGGALFNKALQANAGVLIGDGSDNGGLYYVGGNLGISPPLSNKNILIKDEIGGDTKIILGSSNGNITADGDIISGSPTNSGGTTNGVTIDKNGLVTITGTDGTNNFEIYNSVTEEKTGGISAAGQFSVKRTIRAANNKFFVDDNGTVAIGGTSSDPNIELEYTGNAKFDGILSVGDFSYTADTKGNQIFGGQYIAYHQADQTSSYLTCYKYNGASAQNTQIILLDNGGGFFQGTIQIGGDQPTGTGVSLNPNIELDATGSAKFKKNGTQVIQIENTSETGNVGIDLKLPSHTLTIGANSTANNFTESGTKPFVWNQSAGERMRLDYQGSLLIGPAGSPKVTIKQDGDITCKDNSKGLILTSPNGTEYRLVVDNSGNLTTSAV